MQTFKQLSMRIVRYESGKAVYTYTVQTRECGTGNLISQQRFTSAAEANDFYNQPTAR